VADADAHGAGPPARGALVAGLVPGQLLGWSWPDRLRHALALATGGAGAWARQPQQPQKSQQPQQAQQARPPGGSDDRDHVDLAAYERLLDAVLVEPPSPAERRGSRPPDGGAGLSCSA
jgi:hypothetical protein